MKRFLLGLENACGKTVVETRPRTCVVGFCATIDSRTHLVNQLLLSDCGVNGIWLQYFATYKTSKEQIDTMYVLIVHSAVITTQLPCSFVIHTMPFLIKYATCLLLAAVSLCLTRLTYLMMMLLMMMRFLLKTVSLTIHCLCVKAPQAMLVNP